MESNTFVIMTTAGYLSDVSWDAWGLVIVSFETTVERENAWQIEEDQLNEVGYVARSLYENCGIESEILPASVVFSS